MTYRLTLVVRCFNRFALGETKIFLGLTRMIRKDPVHEAGSQLVLYDFNTNGNCAVLPMTRLRIDSRKY